MSSNPQKKSTQSLYKEGLLKSSNIKHKLYDKFLKKIKHTQMKIYINSRNIYSKLSNSNEKKNLNSYTELISKYKNNLKKKTWSVKKEVVVN